MELEEFLKRIGMAAEACRIVLDFEAGEMGSGEYGRLSRLVWEDRDRLFSEVLNRPEARTLLLWLYVRMACDGWQEYKRRGIPEEVYWDTYSDITLWCNTCRRDYGSYGIAEYDWLWRHVTFRLFRLGRLMFEVYECPEDVWMGDGTAEDGRVRGGWAGDVRAEGVAAGDVRVRDSRAEDVTAGDVRTEGVTAGVLLVKKGSPVLNVHIPEGGPLSESECQASFLRAVEFFGGGMRLFICHSWLLYPGLKLVLPEDSNILKFQKRFTVYKTDSECREAEERVFLYKKENPAEYPENTGLQRAMKRELINGHRFGSGYGIFKMNAEEGDIV